MSTDAGDDILVVPGKDQRLWDEVRAYNERRAVIEQAKGMLMFVLGIDSVQAFDVLRSHSQSRNIKLYLVAEQIQKNLVGLASIQGPLGNAAIGRVLGTTPMRVDDVDRQRDGHRKIDIPLQDIDNRT